MPTEPSRPRSVLGPLTLFAALAAVGILGVTDALGAEVAVAGYVAAALAVVGVGLVVGTWVGRSRGLIAAGVGLTLVLVPIATVEQLGLAQAASERFESVTVEPSSIAEIDGVTREYGVGEVRYDLSDLDFAGQTAELDLRVGAGDLVIEVPPQVTLVVDVEVGAGELDLLGQSSSGLALSGERTFAGQEGAGSLVLTVRMGFGSVEVDRAQA